MFKPKSQNFAHIVSIDWRPNNRRAKSLAKDLGAKLYLAPNILRKRIYAPIRYVCLVLWTISLLVRNRPKVVIASSPPPFIPIIVLAYAMVFNCKYIVDACHLATMGYWSKIPFGFWFNKMVMNKGLITLVHNENIKKLTDKQGIRTIVLETKVPQLRTMEKKHIDDNFTVMVPCSFDPDEPIEEIFRAADTMSETKFFITGNYSRLNKKIYQTCPANATMTGFLSEIDYDSMLNSVDAVLVLSCDDYPVRPRGASEAIAAGKPLIVSKNQATQNHLDKGAVLINNTKEEIIQGVLRIRSRYEKYQSEMKLLKQERLLQYKLELEALNDLIRGKQLS
jgi:glycosyltransferase involved in cell wall biosynthesis